MQSPERATDPRAGDQVSLRVKRTEVECAGGIAISDLCLGGTHGEWVDRILAIARDVLSTPDVTADDELAGHGGTSLSIIRIVAEASRALDLDIDPRDLGGTVTVRNLARVARAPVQRPSSDQP